MLARLAALATAGSLLLVSPALADRAGDAPIKAPSTLKTHHVAFTLPGDRWLQEINVFGGNPSYGHYRLATSVAGGRPCTLTATVIGKWRVGPLVSRGGRVRLSASDELVVRRQGRSGAIRWWAGRRGANGASALGSRPLPARLAKGSRRHMDVRVTIQHFAAQPADHDACYALGRSVSVEVAQTLRVASGPPVFEGPFVDECQPPSCFDDGGTSLAARQASTK